MRDRVELERRNLTKPNVFLVGAAKCGTTSLTQYLAPHPDVFLCNPRETFHFCTDLDVHPGMQVPDRQEYINLFRKAENRGARIDGSVWHIYSKTAARAIKEFAPDAKIIIMLRNPIDVMWSLHGWYLYTAAEDILDFREALEAQDDRRAGRRIPKDTVCRQTLLYTDVATFSPQVERYFDTFDRDRVKVILFDDFIADTPGEFRRILEFLEIDPEFQVDFTVHGAASEIRNPSVKILFRKHRWLRTSLGRVVPERVRGAMGKTLAAVKPKAQQRQKRMDPELRRTLLNEFKPEIERLGRLLDRDLSHWLKEKPKD